MDPETLLQPLRAFRDRGLIRVQSEAPYGGMDESARWVDRIVMTPEQATMLVDIINEALAAPASIQGGG